MTTEWITSNPEIWVGSPAFAGRGSASSSFWSSLASGASNEDILRVSPHITAEGLTAAIQYAAKALKNEVVWEVKIPA